MLPWKAGDGRGGSGSATLRGGAFYMGVSHGVSENLEETMGNHGFNPERLIVDHPVRDLAGH